MDKIKIIKEYGQFEGLRENKEGCINIRMSDFNDGKKIIKISDAKVVRLLIDIESIDYRALIDYLNKIQQRYPNIEFHINMEFDKYFEYAKKIINDVNFNKKNITLWPDGELKDRSYLNLANLNCNTVIPLQYAMWHSKITDADPKKLYFCRTDIEVKDGTIPFSINSEYMENGRLSSWGDGSNLYDLKAALHLVKQASSILSTDLKDVTECNLADDQKILLIMKYFVDNFTYTEISKSPDKRITFLDSTFVHNGANVLIDKGGVCEGIAEAFMILLNNPTMRIDCRCLGGLANKYDEKSGHSWNVIKHIDEKNKKIRWFYMDPTFNISDKDYFKWSFLDASQVRLRKIYDCANPNYQSADNIKYEDSIMQKRLNDALNRIEKKKNGVHQLRIIESFDKIVKR